MHAAGPEDFHPQNDTRFRTNARSTDDAPAVDPRGIDAFGSEIPDVPPIAAAGAVSERGAPAARSQRAGTLARAFGALALVEALVIAALLISRASVVDAPGGRLVIESDPTPADVWLDGRHLGMTPLSLPSAAGERALRIDVPGASQTMKVDVADGQVTHARVDFVKVPAAAAAEIAVRPPPGRRTLQYVTDELGLRTRTATTPVLSRDALAIAIEPQPEAGLDGRYPRESPLADVLSEPEISVDFRD